MHVGSTARSVEADTVDVPRRLAVPRTKADRVFRGLTAGVGTFALFIVGATAAFLFWQARPAFKHSGWIGFFKSSIWNPSLSRFGIAGLLIGTFLIATIALALAVPIALATAIFINEYAPAPIRKVLVSAIDLLAALPSLIFGLWGLFALSSHLNGPAHWFGNHLSAIPIFRFTKSPPPEQLAQSAFVAGVIVGVMIIPVISSVSRDVMAQVPRELCEGALALGGSRWGMIRQVILPFGRSGIIGAALLGFGRALGETIAVAIVLSLTVRPNWHVLETNGGSIAGWIAVKFGEASETERAGLVAAGLALFLVTLLVNAIARVVVKRTTRFA